MKLFSEIVLSSFLISIIGCANLTNYDSSMYEIQFGLLYKSDEQKYTITETNTIPYVLEASNQVFGYLITPKHDNKYVYNAIVVLPDKPEVLEGKYIGSKDTSTSQGLDTGTAKARGPSTVNMWLNDGDAKGLHKISLFINGSLADNREFLID